MKEIIAYIKPQMLPEVTFALHHLEGVSQVKIVQPVQEVGWRKSTEQPYRGQEDGVEEIDQVEIKIYCEDELMESVVSTIQQKAHTGLRGDGNIYVSHIEMTVQISNGERLS